MSPGPWLLLQYAIVALAVIVSAWVVFDRHCPDVARRLRIRLALILMRKRLPGWVRVFGKWVAPAPNAAGEGCGGCNRCGTESAS